MGGRRTAAIWGCTSKALSGKERGSVAHGTDRDQRVFCWVARFGEHIENTASKLGHTQYGLNQDGKSGVKCPVTFNQYSPSLFGTSDSNFPHKYKHIPNTYSGCPIYGYIHRVTLLKLRTYICLHILPNVFVQQVYLGLQNTFRSYRFCLEILSIKGYVITNKHYCQKVK